MTREERAKQVREQYSGSIHGFDEQAQIAAMLAFADAEAAAMREALTLIGSSAPNHCVCCTMMGKTARQALAQ